MSANVTGSKLELFERCAAAGALPAVWTETTDDQAAGHARHRFLERAPAVGRDAALAEVEECYRAQCEGIDVDEVPEGVAELAFAYDVETDRARVLGQWLGRAYEVTATEVSGTADLVCAPSASLPRWLVVDWKGDEEVPPAATNVQLGFYALAVARVNEVDEVDVAIGYIGHDGTIRWDRATLGPFELEAAAARVREVFARVAAARALVASGRTPDVSKGMHCRRCPAMAACPAMTSLARELVRDVEVRTVEQEVSAVVQLTDAQAGEVWVRLKLARELLDGVEASLRARAEVRGLPLPDGSRLMPIEVPQRTITMAKALPVLLAKFGPQAEEAVERSLSMGAITKLARQTAPGKGQKKALLALLEELRAAGGLRESKFTQLRVRKAGVTVDAQDGES